MMASCENNSASNSENNSSPSTSSVFRQHYSQIFDVMKKSKTTRERLCTRLYSSSLITEAFLEDMKEKSFSDSECSFMIMSRLSALAKEPDDSKYIMALQLMEEEEEFKEIAKKMASPAQDTLGSGKY